MRLRTSSVLLLVVLFLHHIWLGAAQQMMPFPGQGQEPDEPTTVFVSTYIDRLMYIDDKNYEFQVSADATSALALCWVMLGHQISKWCAVTATVVSAHLKSAQQRVFGPWNSLALGTAQSADDCASA